MNHKLEFLTNYLTIEENDSYNNIASIDNNFASQKDHTGTYLSINKLYKSIFNRKSVRDYQRFTKDETIILFNIIQNMLLNINNFTKNNLPSLRFDVFINDDDSIFSGIAGNIGKIKNAPVAIGIICKDNLKDNLAKNRNNQAYESKNANLRFLYAGYLGELLVLYLCSSGYGTCWVSGLFNRKSNKFNILKENKEKLICVIAAGKKANFSPLDIKLIYGMVGKRRKPDRLVFSENLLKNFSDSKFKEALKAFKLSPSAVNRQPWYLDFYDNKLFLLPITSSTKNIINKSDNSGYYLNSKDKENKIISVPEYIQLDCGIAMLHLEIALKTLYPEKRNEWQWQIGDDAFIPFIQF